MKRMLCKFSLAVMITSMCAAVIARKKHYNERERGIKMTREQAEKMIGQKLIEISKIVEAYYPRDDYLSASIHLREGVIHFNNTFWEHAVGKIDKSLFREGGEWK